MESIDLWPLMWQKLYDNGASAKQEEGTRRYWLTLSDDERQIAFTTISKRLEEGKFVWYDPIRAIEENLRRKRPRIEPTNYNGRALPKEPVFSAKYQGKWGMYTQADIAKYGMERASS